MKIALIGFGKMGKIIQACAEERGHKVVATFDSQNPLNAEKLQLADVAIDFSIPALALGTISFCLEHNIPLVMGTTGWYEHLSKIEKDVEMAKGTFLWASNFSIGVNLFFELNIKLAQLMASHSDTYKVKIEEIHHTQKLDSPSGTAISLANAIIENTSFSTYHTIDSNTENGGKTLPNIPIYARRIPEIPGTHVISYESSIDNISIKHEANNRLGFAQGAVIASEFIFQKTGFFTMKDVLKSTI